MIINQTQGAELDFNSKANAKKGELCSSLKRAVKNPSLSIISTAFSTIALIIAAICIVAICETLYHRTLSTFAQAALNSITSRVASSFTTILHDRALFMDELSISTELAKRMVPTAEDADLARNGIVTPLGPSVVNASSGKFIYNFGSKIPNSSLAVSTWRDFYGNQMATMRLSKQLFFSEFEAVFTDGAYIQADNVDLVNTGRGRIAPTYSNSVLYDGILLSNNSYYVRVTPFSSRASNDFEFDKSTINVSFSNQTDRRKEGWYGMLLRERGAVFDYSSTGWSEIQINPTSGAAWLNIVVRLDTFPKGGVYNLGKARLSFNLDTAHYASDSLFRWMPLHNVQTYTISYTNGVIIAAEEFTANPLLSLHHTVVPVGFKLSASDVSKGCVLVGNQQMTCRHTVSSYGNRALQKAREATRSHFDDIRFFLLSFISIDAVGGFDSGRPEYVPFECDGEQYYVSALSVQVRPSLRDDNWMPVQWLTMSIVPQSEVTGVLSDVRAIVVAVTIGIVIFLSIVFAMGTRFVMGPVGEIAFLMTASAYLKDSSSGNGSNPDLSPKQIELINKKLRDRSLSHWAEVRAIQEAYFEMSDELQELKAYIPEHLRNEIIAARAAKKSPSQRSENQPMNRPLSSDFSSSASNSATDDDVGHATPDENSLQRTKSKEKARTMPLDTAPLPSKPTIEPRESAGNPLVVATSSLTNESPPISGSDRLQCSDLNSVANPQPSSSTLMESYMPIFFADSCLVDRDITVVHMNIVGFHHYARRKHPMTISSDYAEFITYINSEVKRFGGVLESFFGDKFWVSFNATSKCVHHEVSACYFAYYVTQVANDVSKRYRAARQAPAKEGERPPKPVVDKRFALCASGGISCGVSNGRAFVGPLGNSSIKRHTIISNAISEAAALERQSLHYNGCSVFIATEMIRAIDGFAEYVLVDSSLLPGSLGKRRMIANVQGVMLDPTVDVNVVRRWLKEAEPPSGTCLSNFVFSIERPLASPGTDPEAVDGKEEPSVERSVPSVNRCRSINDCFLALLQGNIADCKRLLKDIRDNLCGPDVGTLEPEGDYKARHAVTTIMVQLIEAVLASNGDGRNYRSTLGNVYIRTSKS